MLKKLTKSINNFKLKLFNYFFLLKKGLFVENKIFTHVTVDEKIILFKVLTKNNKSIKNCVEIGSYLGASSCFIASALKNDSKLFCIDTWGNHAMKYVDIDVDGEERDTYIQFKTNTLSYSTKIIPIRKWSTEAIYDIKNLISQIDFLFIDGDHNYDGVKIDWELYSPLLTSNSIVAFHDTGWAEGVQRVIKEDVIGKATLIAELPNIQFFKIN